MNKFEYYILPEWVGQQVVVIAARMGPISLTTNKSDTDLVNVTGKTRATPTSPPSDVVFSAATQEQLKELYENPYYGGAGGFQGKIGKRPVKKSKSGSNE